MRSSWWVLLPVLLAAAPLPGNTLRMRRVASIPIRPELSQAAVVIGDTDQDGRLEVHFRAGTGRPGDPWRREAWEYRAVNSWQLVHADTSVYPYPSEPVTGNFFPMAVGDFDGDGLSDIVGFFPVVRDSIGKVVVGIVESEAPDSYPTRLAWTANETKTFYPHYVAYTDLDQDGNTEVLASWGGVHMWEARGDDSLVQIRLPPHGYFPTRMAIGDFDGDGLMEYATGFSTVYVHENVTVGTDSYVLVYEEQTHRANGFDVFSGDIDGSGVPVFFISYDSPRIRTLWMWEGTDNNRYESHHVDVRLEFESDGYYSSTCGDLDGDGTDEVIWATQNEVVIYKAGPGRQFEQVWSIPLHPEN
ncbi:MAG TPA: VCBS repeat-containing protein, partial [candidate division WOR-3 bacterium]|nr:VCBS repeat-containing protein [candidate division WOR-3 bacterium]